MAGAEGPGPEADLARPDGGALQLAPGQVPDQRQATAVLTLKAGLGPPRSHLDYPDGPGQQGGETSGHPEHLTPTLHHRSVNFKEISTSHGDYIFLALFG